MLIEEIRYRDGAANLAGVLVHDESHPGNRPGVLVVHGGAGLDAHARKQALRLADAGYVVFACDMYGGDVIGNREKTVREINAFRADRARLTTRVRAGLDAFASRARFDGRIAVVGYCFGGLVALELARSGIELAAVVSVHGTLTTTQPVEARAIRTPVLACQGALDPHCSLADAMRFADEMRSLDADWELVIYGHAMHGFTHEDARGQMPGVLPTQTGDRSPRFKRSSLESSGESASIPRVRSLVSIGGRPHRLARCVGSEDQGSVRFVREHVLADSSFTVIDRAGCLLVLRRANDAFFSTR